MDDTEGRALVVLSPASVCLRCCREGERRIRGGGKGGDGEKRCSNEASWDNGCTAARLPPLHNLGSRRRTRDTAPMEVVETAAVIK